MKTLTAPNALTAAYDIANANPLGMYFALVVLVAVFAIWAARSI